MGDSRCYYLNNYRSIAIQLNEYKESFLKKLMNKVYDIITERVISLLEKGTVPWHKPWSGQEHHPKNLVSKKEYNGINTFMLSSAGYDSPYWVTFKQARDKGGNVKKGERGFPCVFWKWLAIEDKENRDKRNVPFLRYYTVFNVLQCDGIEIPVVGVHSTKFHSNEICERIVSEMPNPPKIKHEGGMAFYTPSHDRIMIPPQESFYDSEFYYCTLFHELTHSTGHKSRLSRPGIETIISGSNLYSKEELIAEMGAAFLCGYSGIENKIIDNSASYISSWLVKLMNDSRLVVHAAGQAQKAADYILRRKGKDAGESYGVED